MRICGRDVQQKLSALHETSICGRRIKYAALALWVCLGVAALSTIGAPGTGEIKGQVLTQRKIEVAGAVCSLSGPSLPAQRLQVATGQNGNFDFPGLLWGDYSITCGAPGYRPLVKSNLELRPAQSVVRLQVVLVNERVFRQRVEVRAHAGLVPEQQTGAPPSTLVSQQLVTLPLAEMKFKAALPLVPGVVRTPDGKLNIKGEPETKGLLLVDSATVVDPVTGSFSVDVPIDVIESLQVYKSPYLAEFGGFSGGLTVIHTKPPADKWHWELDDPIPDFFFEGGHIVGVQDDEPRLYITAPLIKNKLNMSESLVYFINRPFIEGLPWPKNLKRQESLTSFTDLQYVFSPHHLLSVNGRVFPKKDEFANIDALIPQPASQNYGQNGYDIGGTDRYLFASGGVLTSLFEFTQFNTNAYGQGPADMLVTPNGYGGNYFNVYQRHSNQEQARETFAWRRREWHGWHQLKMGLDYFRRSYTGASNSHPVLVTGGTGSLLERIDFSSPGVLAQEDEGYGGFAQDDWLVNAHLSLDVGLRYTDQTVGSHTALAPRFGFSYSPESGGRTVLHGGAGIFYDREPLLAADFPENPSRIISFFSPQGTLLAPPLHFSNMYGIPEGTGTALLPSLRRPDTAPYDETWSFQLDQELHPGWLLRLSYLSSYGRNQFDVVPQGRPGGNPALLLSNVGRSHYQGFVSTTRVRIGESADMDFSYVYSRARGDLNSLDEIYVPFEQPIIRPNFYANLPSDMPNRFITWSTFHLPDAMTLSPVFDIHSGLPFSAIDARQNYVGIPNSSRFPHFYSLDVKWMKTFRMSVLPFPFFKRHVFRAGFAVFDITDHLNPLDVYNNDASPYFGHFTGFQHRTFATYFDLVK